jgi:hypothetical protein
MHIGGVVVQLHSFLTSAGEWPSSCPDKFTSGIQAGWAPKPVWAPWIIERSLAAAIFKFQIVQHFA